MPKDKEHTRGDYEVGYGKPPKHSRFIPGQSGNKGNRKKGPEGTAAIIARVVYEKVPVGDDTMTRLELAIRSTCNQTIKSGKPRDLKALFDLFELHGLFKQQQLAVQAQEDAEKVVQELFPLINFQHGIGPEDAKILDDTSAAEVELVMTCPSCGPRLRDLWNQPDYKACRAHLPNESSAFHGQVLRAKETPLGRGRPK